MRRFNIGMITVTIIAIIVLILHRLNWEEYASAFKYAIYDTRGSYIGLTNNIKPINNCIITDEGGICGEFKFTLVKALQ